MAFAPDTRIGGGADLFGRHGRIFVISLGNSEQVGEKRGFPRGQRKLFRDPWHGDCASFRIVKWEAIRDSSPGAPLTSRPQGTIQREGPVRGGAVFDVLSFIGEFEATRFCIYGKGGGDC